MEKKTKTRKEEEREMHLKPSPKNRDVGNLNTSSRNVPMSSQSKRDTWPTSMQHRHVAINVIEMESQRPHSVWGDPSHSLDRQES